MKFLVPINFPPEILEYVREVDFKSKDFNMQIWLRKLPDLTKFLDNQSNYGVKKIIQPERFLCEIPDAPADLQKVIKALNYDISGCNFVIRGIARQFLKKWFRDNLPMKAGF